MKQVSAAYKAGMCAALRNRSHVRVVFSNVDTTAPTDGEWVSNGQQAYSETDTLDYDYDYRESYATLELNRWALDGGSIIIPESGKNQDGFISDKMSGADGSFPEPAELTREFAAQHTFPGLTLTFDTRYHEWPVSATVKFLLGGLVVKSITAPVAAETVQIDEKIDACDKIVITLDNTLPYRRPRLEAVLYGLQKVFSNGQIESTKQAHDVDPLSRRLPKETMQFTVLDYEHEYDLDNPTGLYKYIDAKSPISIQFGYELDRGNVEWVRADRYILNGKPRAEKNKAAFSGTGLIESLTGMFYKSKLGEKTFYDMAEEVLRDADLTPDENGDNPWVIDESLKTMTTTAVLPIDTHMDCLQMIAHACRCKLFTDDGNVIHILPFVLNADEQQTDFTLDFSTIGEKAQTCTKVEPLKTVTVAKYAYTAADSASKIFEGTTTETQMHVEFSAPAQDIQIAVDGGTLVSSGIYARAADLVLSPGTKTVVITGKPLSESSVVLSYPVGQDGEIDKEENPLITNDEMCAALAEHVKNYLKLRNTYDCEYRGNPEIECGDIIGLQTMYTAKMNALVLTDEITFNGSLSGKAKVKALI